MVTTTKTSRLPRSPLWGRLLRAKLWPRSKRCSTAKSHCAVAAADACLTAADALLSENRNAEAAKVFAAIRAAELPKHINVASRFGEIRAGTVMSTIMMTQYLAA